MTGLMDQRRGTGWITGYPVLSTAHFFRSLRGPELLRSDRSPVLPRRAREGAAR